MASMSTRPTKTLATIRTHSPYTSLNPSWSSSLPVLPSKHGEFDSRNSSPHSWIVRSSVFSRMATETASTTGRGVLGPNARP